MDPMRRWGVPNVSLEGTRRLAMKDALRNFREYAMYGVFHKTLWLVLEVKIPKESVARYFQEQKLTCWIKHDN